MRRDRIAERLGFGRDRDPLHLNRKCFRDEVRRRVEPLSERGNAVEKTPRVAHGDSPRRGVVANRLPRSRFRPLVGFYRPAAWGNLKRFFRAFRNGVEWSDSGKWAISGAMRPRDGGSQAVRQSLRQSDCLTHRRVRMTE